MRDKAWIGPILVTLVVSLVGCARGRPSAREPSGEPSEGTRTEGVVQLEPELPAGEHLQAVFEVPERLEGSTMVHRRMNYLLYLPAGYGEDQEALWPLIAFLHGSGADEYDATFVLSHGLPGVLAAGEQPQDFPFVVISPQAYSGETWWSGDTLMILAALVDEVVASYRIDPDRVYLTGLDMGGYGCWHLATHDPERFAAVVSISGSGYQTPSTPKEETLCRLKDLPIWGIHGAQDSTADPMASQNALDALAQSCQGNVKWTLYEDVGHEGAYERAYRDPGLYAWMLQHSR